MVSEDVEIITDSEPHDTEPDDPPSSQQQLAMLFSEIRLQEYGDIRNSLSEIEETLRNKKDSEIEYE